jgi:adenylosuccinate lyase
VRRGVGREVAHEAIKQHAVAVALAMREKGIDHNDLFERLAADDRLQLTDADIAALLSAPLAFAGAATAQVAGFCDQVALVTARYPDAAFYAPGDIL